MAVAKSRLLGGGGAAEATELLESLDRETGLLSEQGCRWSKVVAET